MQPFSSLGSVPRDDARILLVRLSAIGDVVHGLPVLNALRESLPKAFLAWIVEDRAAALLRSHHALDELIVLPRRWYTSPGMVLAIRRRIRRLKFDLSIDLQGLTKSAGLPWMSGVPRRIGFTGPDGREFSPWMNTELVKAVSAHVVDRNLELLRPLGFPPQRPNFALDESTKAVESAAGMLAALRLESGFAVINPGAGWKSKLWPPDRFAAVARWLGRRHGLPSLVVWAGEHEKGYAVQIVSASQGHALLAPQTNLGQLAAIARRADLFIASDTGPLHIASAVGTPCVGLYGPMPAERNGPYGPRHATVQQVCLQGSRRYRRTAGPESMEAIEVDHVIEACAKVLEQVMKAA